MSNGAQSLPREQIVHSVLQPSDKFPPQYQARIILSVDGSADTGLQLDHQADGAMKMFLVEGYRKHFSGDNDDEYYASERSIMPDGLESNLTVSELRD
ncbi:MAG: hypothetical protein CMJ58_10365 [Planctomycetaceae bacterium]|nr:hypothetical protein [Planctomycetaceae bacterium]